MADEPSDIDLLRRHVDGDADAFAELFRRHRDRLWAVALRVLGNREDAEDAVQNAVIAALRAAAGFRGDSAVTTWLHRIVVNAALDLARRRQVRLAAPLSGDGPPLSRDPIGKHETALDVAAALATLPVEQRAALVLVDVTGHSVDEAARVLEVPAGTVKSRCARGRARLAVVLAPAGGNPAAPPAVPSPAEPSVEEVDPGHGPG